MSYPQFQAASDYLGAIADEDYVKALPSNSYEDRGGAVLDGPEAGYKVTYTQADAEAVTAEDGRGILMDEHLADPSSICGWNPDMYGVRNTEAGQSYYDSLIEMYASWGVDFIKCDDICDSFIYRNDSFSGWHESEILYKAIQKSNREIVLSLSPGPAHIDRAW